MIDDCNFNTVKQLKNFSQKVIEDNVTVKICKQPCYLSCFLTDENQNSDIILLYKTVLDEIFEGLDETAKMMKDVSAVNVTSYDGDITGQPLECPFSPSDEFKLDDFTINEPNIVLEKDSHYPISACSALKIFNYSNINLKLNLPLWMLVDSTDLQKSVLLGLSIKENVYSRSWVTIEGAMQAELLDSSLKDMLNKHDSYTFLKNRVVAEVSCKFRISHFMPGDFSGSVFVCAIWNKASIEIPVSGASMSLEFNVTVGKEISDLYPLWQQLLLIQKLFDVILKWKNNNSYPLPHRQADVTLPTSNNIFNNNQVELTLEERIIDVIVSPHQWSTEYKNVCYNEILSNIKNGATFGMDLTGRLWVLLSECSTYEELAVFMKIAFQQVRKCSVKPFVNTQNKSKLSDAMKILSSDPSANLQMLEPLELLIEIGIEKLKNDYIALFTQSGIAKEELLNIPNFISFTTMDNITWIETVSSYITWMSKIHSVAEVVHIAQFGLEVTPDVSTIIQRIFAYYLSPGSPVTSLQYLCKNPDLKFVTPIVNFRGQSNRNLKYEKWLMKLTTNEQHRSITTCFLRTLNFPFPDNMFSFSDKNNITVAMDNTVLGSSTDDKYFCSVMTSVSNKIGVK